MPIKLRMLMKRLRRILLGTSFITTLVCVVLLLNFTAPNPTGRRYSSEMPVTTGQGSSQEIGVSGERVLSIDLGVPRNENPTELQCFCNNLTPAYSPSINECRSCIAFAQLTSPYRRPDFVSPNFIAESKNTQGLFYENRDFDQIGDYVIAARAMGRPLWVFVRVNTNVDPEYYEMVRSTGGDIVPYFTVAGYQDPLDRLAFGMLWVALVVFAFSGLLEFLAQVVQPAPVKVKAIVPSEPIQIIPPAPTKAKVQPENRDLRRAIRDADAVEDFLKRTEEKARSTIDREKTREDDDLL
jgi:hypothetical protein